MKKNQLSELTLDELYKKKNTLKGATIGLGIVMLIAFSILLYLVFKSRNFALITIIPAGLISLIPGIIGLAQVNSEIKLRKAK